VAKIIEEKDAKKDLKAEEKKAKLVRKCRIASYYDMRLLSSCFLLGKNQASIPRCP
jgi:hypothetical protein